MMGDKGARRAERDRLIIEQKLQKMSKVRDQYNEQLQELFFLQSGGNLMDLTNWRRRRPNKLLDDFMVDNRLDDEDLSNLAQPERPPESTEPKKVEDSKTVETNRACSPAAAAVKEPVEEPVPEPVVNPQEQMALQAKREATVLRRVNELTREGLWSVKRLPKVFEPQRKKSHWDYLVEEMQWLATDFAQERRWKKAAAKRLCHSAAKLHLQKLQKEQKAEKDEGAKLRKIASGIAREVRQFWMNIEKIVKYKQTSRLAETRAKALNMHLNFIVGQTEKYSNWLAEGIAPAQGSPATTSRSLSRAASVVGSENADETGEDVEVSFSASGSEDDEETIEKEEAAANEEAIGYDEEIRLLEKEADIDIEELRRQLEAESDAGKTEEEEEDATDFVVGEEMEGQDDEETMEQEEEEEKGVDHRQELRELQEEGEMSIEELKDLYGPNPDAATSEDSLVVEEDSDNEEDEEEEEDEENEEVEEGNEMSGLELLIKESDMEAGHTKLTNVAAEAEMLQPRGYTLESTTVNTPVPFLLKHILREYQHIGLHWLVTMHDKCLNGILADEMGLGKTIQTIALLGHLACERGNWGPHLIVVPTSVILNWEMEFKKWCPAFKLLTYWGSPKDRKQKRQGWTKANTFHVCITSYKLVVQDQHVFRRKKWKYFILDEAQHIKNFQSQRWQTLLNFNSHRRLLLTGTPLQNHLMELWSLMHFLMPHVFSSHQEFKEWFSNPLTGMIEGSQEYNESIVKRLHKVLRPFLLRRLKCEVEKQLPQKYEHVIKCRLSKRQRFLYDDFMSRTKTKETLESGNFLSVINILMQLRKVCNHPDLFEARPTVSSFIMNGILYYTASLAINALEKDPLEIPDFPYLNISLVNFEMNVDSFEAHRSHGLQTPKKLIIELTSNSSTSNQLPSMEVEALADVNSTPESVSATFVAISPVGQAESSPSNDVGTLNHVGLSRMSSYSTRASFVGSAQADEMAIQSLLVPDLVMRKQKTLEDKQNYLHRLNTRRCAQFPMYGTDTRTALAICGTQQFSEDQWEHMSWSARGHQACLLAMKGMTGKEEPWLKLNALEQVLRKPADRVCQLDDILQRFLMYIPPVTGAPVHLHASHVAPSMARNEAIFKAQLEKEISSAPDLLHPIEISSRMQFPETRLIQYDCGKLQTLDALLRDLKKNGHRSLIFTQMTRVLDILECFLNYHGHKYLRLDGATRVDRRQQLMDQFNADKRIFCFILSTRSGGLGVNLTGADTVIFYDSDWNPTMDAQAQDRCHRIGQTRDVHIYRLISEHTIEENILKKAKQKRLLGDLAIEGGSFTTDFFKNRDIRDIFNFDQGEGQVEVANVQKEVSAMTDKQLEETLADAEDEADVTAANQAKAEQVAELAEFSESVEEQRDSVSAEVQPEVSKTEQELTELESQLNPIERYAVRHLEASLAEYMDWQLKAAESQVEINKKNWELSHLQALRQAEEQKVEEEEEMLLTYAREEVSNKVKKKKKQPTSSNSTNAKETVSVTPKVAEPPPPVAVVVPDEPVRGGVGEGRGKKRRKTADAALDADYRPGDDALAVSLEGKKGKGRMTRQSKMKVGGKVSKEVESEMPTFASIQPVAKKVKANTPTTSPQSFPVIRPCHVQISPIHRQLFTGSQLSVVPGPQVPSTVSGYVPIAPTTSKTGANILFPVPALAAATATPIVRPILPSSSVKSAAPSNVPYVLLTLGPNGQPVNRTVLNLPPNVVLKVTSVPVTALPSSSLPPKK
eukprot:m.95532 g.95532  ORF g.95532 m.95532 type:complete len:1744 (+) comp36853_c0_seq1:131-5362(+)